MRSNPFQFSVCSTSGAWGLASSASSLLGERSAALSRRPAATSGSVVVMANLRRSAACSTRYFFPGKILFPLYHPFSAIRRTQEPCVPEKCPKVYLSHCSTLTSRPDVIAIDHEFGRGRLDSLIYFLLTVGVWNATKQQQEFAMQDIEQAMSYRQFLVTTGPVRRRRLRVDGRSAWR